MGARRPSRPLERLRPDARFSALIWAVQIATLFIAVALCHPIARAFRGPTTESGMARALLGLHTVLSSAVGSPGVRTRCADMAGTRVLVVEDDDDMRQELLEGLEADGHSVRGCARIDEALQTLESDGPFDVLITDVRLPGGSGLELLSVLQAQHGMQPARIVITGFGNEDLHESAEALGALAVFDKPFDVDELRSAVFNASSRS